MIRNVTWLCSILLWSSVALCAPSAEDLIAYKEAGARLAVLIASAEDGKKIPQLKTPEVMNLVRTISDEEKILGTTSFSLADLGTILDICDVPNKASVSLMLFDLKAHIDPKATSPEEIQAAMVPLVRSNLLAFQDELAKLQPFLYRCIAKEIPPLTQFALSLKPEEITDVRRQGLTRMRAGFMQVFTTALQTGDDTRFRNDYRETLLATLAETSSAFVSIAELPVRRKMRESIDAAASKARGPSRLYLMRIADAFGEEKCDGLCSIH